jgi:hypothetical protein
MDLTTYDIKDSTHFIKCAHAIGSKSRSTYYMDCTYLNDTKNGKAKVVVFGERNWKNKDHIKKVKYIDPNKLIKK